MRVLFLLFIVVPILEMALLIKVGQWLGVLPTIALVLLTAIVGVTLLKWQGVSTLLRARQKMQAGDIPAEEMFEGIFLAVGGALLLTPGFFTDAIGFACLLPMVRRRLVRYMIRRGILVAGSQVYGAGAYYQSDIEGEAWRSGQHHRPDADRIIEADHTREE